MRDGIKAFTSTDEAIKQFVEYVLRGSNSPHVVIGPIVWQPNDGTAGKRWYFTVASSEPKRGFRCDQLSTDNKEDCEHFRSAVYFAFFQHRPLVLHDTDDELYMARLCETLWPGQRISNLRKTLEAEYEERRESPPPAQE